MAAPETNAMQDSNAPRRPASQPPANGELGEILGALPMLARLAWFAAGAVVAAAVTFLSFTHPWSRPRTDDRALPYEGFPFADNAGVCQEWVALGSSLRTSHADARAIVQRFISALPAGVRAENFRVVRAFAPGDFWTIAVDTQTGGGDEAHARDIAVALSALPGTGVRFEPTFYSSRRLYETAHVLCMPRANVDEHGAAGEHTR